MESDKIIIKGAWQHNLKHINIDLPRNKLIVFTGVSGSGKSSLAFDTLYAEGRRRYVESLSSYARQFLGQMDKPHVDFIGGLSPAISIEQKATGKNPRSTVGTLTEIYDYLRVLFARIGVQYCHKCGAEIGTQSAEQMVDTILGFQPGARIILLAPKVINRKGEHAGVFDEAREHGFIRARVDGEILPLDQNVKLDKNKRHTIEIVVDRLFNEGDARSRLTDSVETTLRLSDGILIANMEGEDHFLNEKRTCFNCNISFEELTPQMFSFNSPRGMCPTCGGLGVVLSVDPDLIAPDATKTIREGAITWWGDLQDEKKAKASWRNRAVLQAMEHFQIDMDIPLQDLPKDQRDLIFYGKSGGKVTYHWESKHSQGEFTREFEGIVAQISRLHKQTRSQMMRDHYERYMANVPCRECNGAKLRPDSLAVRVDGVGIADLTRSDIGSVYQRLDELKLTERDRIIAADLLREIRSRLAFLLNVGLHYLTLDRGGPTLSGGESQRIRLAGQVGCGLVGVVYILDEPSIGLHQRDNARLIETLKDLRNLGNTVIVVEHDRETILVADHIVDFGPGAGRKGGEIVAAGPLEAITGEPRSITGKYLKDELRIETPEKRRKSSGFLTIRGARRHNLKGIDVAFPLGTFTCVSGVSGSGKSSLVNETLYPALKRHFFKSPVRPGKHSSIEGMDLVDRVIEISQKPIGRTPRSNPATYTGVFSHIRNLFAKLPEARLRGYNAGRFSFNIKGGRCEACRGDGVIKVQMHFLADVFVTCEVCRGRRFNSETLEVKYKQHSIADMLDLDVADAAKLFAPVPPIRRILDTLCDVGLDYIHLGQTAPTLSGGEAQRIKLARELCKTATGKTVYILDEPTTGLHFEDVKKLLNVLNRLADAGNTVIVIEHNLDVLKTADYIIDLGPEGGDGGGYIVAQGSPEEIALVEKSHTGKFLREILDV